MTELPFKKNIDVDLMTNSNLGSIKGYNSEDNGLS